jgi:NarL family two-component system response regulator LiaR
MQKNNTTSEIAKPLTTDHIGPSDQNIIFESAAEPIRVAICDLSATIRHGLQHMLSDASGIDVVMKVSSQAEVLSQSDDLDIDVIVIDIEDEIDAGVEYIIRFREKLPDAKILVFTGCKDNTRIVDAIELGVEGFQCKIDADVDEIISAIRTVHKGGRPLAPCVTEALLTHMQSKQDREQANLSLREKEVLDLIATGKTNNDIANYLYISVRTVKFHVSSIFGKLNVKNRTEAALWLL